jgi:hypothetical protein
MEDTSGARMQHQSSDSSSDSDYDEELARKIKQRNTYQVRTVEGGQCQFLLFTKASGRHWEGACLRTAAWGAQGSDPDSFLSGAAAVAVVAAPEASAPQLMRNASVGLTAEDRTDSTAAKLARALCTSTVSHMTVASTN